MPIISLPHIIRQYVVSVKILNVWLLVSATWNRPRGTVPPTIITASGQDIQPHAFLLKSVRVSQGLQHERPNKLMTSNSEIPLDIYYLHQPDPKPRRYTTSTALLLRDELSNPLDFDPFCEGRERWSTLICVNRPAFSRRRTKACGKY